MAGSSAEAIKGRASDAMDAAKDMASRPDRLKQQVDGQKNLGATRRNLATRCAAARGNSITIFRSREPTSEGASQIEGVSDQIKTGNFSDLVRGPVISPRQRRPRTAAAVGDGASTGPADHPIRRRDGFDMRSYSDNGRRRHQVARSEPFWDCAIALRDLAQTANGNSLAMPICAGNNIGSLDWAAAALFPDAARYCVDSSIRRGDLIQQQQGYTPLTRLLKLPS